MGDANTDTTPWDGIVSHLNQEIQLASKEESFDAKTHFREIYKEIVDIPNEHPKKKDLLKSFDEAWEKLWD